MGHMNEFIQQRYIDINKKRSVDDLLQLMIDAIHSGEVWILIIKNFNRINYYQLNY
jgi:hypothetical protein